MRISKINLNNTPWYLKPFFWNQRRKYGQILKPSLVWATIPQVFISLACLYGALDRKKSPISPELRSLITVRVSQINGCKFCVDINSATFIKRAGTEEKCLQLNKWQQSPLFSPKERAALEYAEEITYSDRHPSNECFNQLKLYFSEQDIIELTAVIAFQNMSSKFNGALEIQPQGFCKLDKN
ncbi:MAG: carboxymuconolactone decarboxylase family protein [Tatlockia sp.]|nr:carboxymuconolactone decarboxylase family protein [Tatlockia sp.]